MIRKWGVLSLILLLSFDATAQGSDWHKLASIQVEDLDQISMDNRENIFYADGGGNVVKLSAKGDLVNQYSPLFQAKVDQLEAFWTVNIFLFSADLQQFVMLDLFLNPLSTHSIQQENMGIVKAATLGNNNILWLFDEIGLSLIQYDYRRNVIVQEHPLSTTLGYEKIEVKELMERQNLVFMNIKDQGIFIFDNQGNLLQKLDLDIEQKITIYKDNLYFIKDGFIHRVQFYTGKEELFKLPDPSYINMLVSANKIIFYSPTSIDIYDRPILK
ncbi:MAG: hypothetical protein WD426_10545 [Anditalea sp.]